MSNLEDVEVLGALWTRRAAPGTPAADLTFDQLRARDILVEEYLWLARRIAYKAVIPDHVDREDLISWASSGLLQAVERFDVEKSDGVLHKHFIAYASQRIRGAILDGLKSPQFSWAPRSAWRSIKAQRAAEYDLTQTLGRSPSKAELAAHLEIPQSKLQYLQQQIPVGATNEGEDHGLDALAGSEAPDQEAGLIGLAERVASCLARLSADQQLIMHDVVVGGKTLGATAQVLGVTIADVRALREQTAVALRLELQTA